MQLLLLSGRYCGGCYKKEDANAATRRHPLTDQESDQLAQPAILVDKCRLQGYVGDHSAFAYIGMELIIGQRYSGTFCPDCGTLIQHEPEIVPTDLYCLWERKWVKIPPPRGITSTVTSIDNDTGVVTFDVLNWMKL